MAFKDAPQCTATAKSTGNRCERPASTGHSVCSVHGVGKLEKRGGRPPTHGRYQNVQHPRLQSLIAEFQDDADPLNLLPDLAAARALFVDFINRHDEFARALLDWHRSFTAAERPISERRLQELEVVIDELEALTGPADLEEEDEEEEGARVRRAIRESRQLLDVLRTPLDETKPRQVLDISDAMRHVDIISKIVKRIEDIYSQDAISRRDLMRIINEMGRSVDLRVKDEGTRQQIHDDWVSIRL